MLSDDNKITRDLYGSYGPKLWGVRSWGKYEEPFAFNIVVNDMTEVQNHEDVPLTQTETFGIQSSLSGGIRAQLKKA